QRQEISFRAHCAAARVSGLPIVVHTRDADDETMRILEDEQTKGAFPGLIHCFTAGPELARRALAMGFSISVSGIVTFRNAEAIRQTLADVPLDRLLVETDAPFLAPMPHRGKTNEPALVVHTAERLAVLKGLSPAALADATSANFFRLFHKVRRQLAA
ncbi:MAG: TatD family hydrolase, partial [Alphaproteobacteria bacterium]